MSDQPRLPTNRVFVVQFDSATDGRQQRYQGRIEHVISGQARNFASDADLMAFVDRVLRQNPSIRELATDEGLYDSDFLD